MDSRCYSLIIEPVTKVCLLYTPTYGLSSHQEHRAFCLRCLAELARKPAGSRPLLSTAVIDFLPIIQARLNFYRFCPFQGIVRALWKVAMPFIRVVLFFNIFFNDHQTCISNQHHGHLVCSILRSCLVYI